MLHITTAIISILFMAVASAGILYPRTSETREVVSLDGIWKFRSSPDNKPNAGFKQGWFLKDLEHWIDMPVPSSYNDITTDPKLRDFVGWVWYQRRFFAPVGWKTERIYIRFGSVQYTAQIFLNGKSIGTHIGGHLPFKFEISDVINFGKENLLTVAVNNTLTRTTIPQGSIILTNNTDNYPPGYILYDHEYRYFNYAGLHRPVYIYTVPPAHIDDITIQTHIEGSTGIISYVISTSLPVKITDTCTVEVVDAENKTVAQSLGLTGSLKIIRAHLWWPIHSHPNPGYLYTLKVHLETTTSNDIYRHPVGIRQLHWNATSFLINNKAMYLRGFGKHEDYDIIGRGLDLSLLIRDMNLMAWMGANSFRTSHYPYSEEQMDLVDKHGYMVIMEAPACTIKFFSPKLLAAHKRVITEMVNRDKNRPSVIMWSLANEPYSDDPKAENYFGTLVNLTKQLDTTRPVTFVSSRTPHKDKAVKHVDVLCVNRYPSWYDDGGRIELIKHRVEEELKEWHKIFNKSVIVTEYGASSVPSLHSLPSSMWSNEYHIELLREHFLAFDSLRILPSNRFLAGEMVWNFADFATQQEIIRPGFCMKGLFTRQRQPKMAAHVTRQRYLQLIRGDNELELKSNYCIN